MNISSVTSMPDYLAQQATTMSGNKVQRDISMAILKQTMDQMQANGEAIVRMIQQSSISQGIGGQVDIRA